MFRRLDFIFIRQHTICLGANKAVLLRQPFRPQFMNFSASKSAKQPITVDRRDTIAAKAELMP